MKKGFARYLLVAAFLLVGYVLLILFLHRFFGVVKITNKMFGFVLLSCLPLLILMVKVINKDSLLRENQIMLEKLQRSNLESASFREIGKILSSTLDLETILQQSLTIIEESLSFDGCAIWSYEPDKCGLNLMASLGTDELQLPKRIPGNYNLHRQVFKKKAPLFAEEMEGLLTKEELQFFKERNINSLMIYPVFDNHLPLGLIAMFNHEKTQFDEEKRDFLEAFVNTIALAIKNAWLYKKAYEQSIHDELTGLYNHRFLMSRLEEEVLRAIRLDHPLSLLIFDLDDFKKFNDTYGHLEGNRILSQFGSLLKSGVRSIDIPARFGGEEFVVILPETDLEIAVVVAERLQRNIRNHSCLQGDDGKTQVTCSIGGASLSDKVKTVAQLLNEADAMLYKAKQQKDCVVADI